MTDLCVETVTARFFYGLWGKTRTELEYTICTVTSLIVDPLTHPPPPIISYRCQTPKKLKNINQYSNIHIIDFFFGCLRVYREDCSTFRQEILGLRFRICVFNTKLQMRCFNIAFEVLCRN